MDLDPDFVFDVDPVDMPTWSIDYQLQDARTVGPAVLRRPYRVPIFIIFSFLVFQFERSSTEDKIARMRARQKQQQEQRARETGEAGEESDDAGSDGEASAAPLEADDAGAGSRKRRKQAQVDDSDSDDSDDDDDDAAAAAEQRKRDFFAELPDNAPQAETFAAMNLSRPLMKVKGNERMKEKKREIKRE